MNYKWRDIPASFMYAVKMEKAFARCADRDYLGALLILSSILHPKANYALEAKLLEGHCLFKLGKEIEASEAFEFAAQQLNLLEKLGPDDRMYLKQYMDQYFLPAEQIVPIFIDPKFVTSRFLRQFPIHKEFIRSRK
jgi:hypothetical protein